MVAWAALGAMGTKALAFGAKALGAYDAVNKISGGRVSKTLDANKGKIGGWVAKKLRLNKIGLINKASNLVATESENALGKDDEFAKHAKDFNDQMKGETMHLNRFDGTKENVSSPLVVLPYGPYGMYGNPYERPFDPLTGGSNWYHYGRRRKTVKLETDVKKATKKKPRKRVIKQ
ncbi:hypothetical protein TVAG_281830 [Trichomonas vaginalis G3]|uniref:Uncharacterized protein n=1 Tax=Trichomonas vaginalis (strain ATCC PRA-98 / G3) TaxID=412133 RepID=A2E9P8_TRIV3|nr:hypothetical protein TVAG_281830 [Trichomonas vaginalis G3]|eukprot:XP_001322806.1 hypothetical protein [Trichomonas vaginalis G3]